MKTPVSEWVPRDDGAWTRTPTGGLITLHVWEDEGAWRCRVNGLKASRTFASREAAQRCAEDTAEVMLEKALSDLGEG